MWRNSDGNYGPLAYAVLAVLIVATIAMLVYIAFSPAGGAPLILPQEGKNQ